MTTKAKTTEPLVDPAEMARLATRIAALEAENAGLKARPVPAPQAMDTTPKNPTVDLVQLTRSGNERTTIDPSLEFVAEVAASSTPTEKERVPWPTSSDEMDVGWWQRRLAKWVTWRLSRN